MLSFVETRIFRFTAHLMVFHFDVGVIDEVFIDFCIGCIGKVPFVQ